MPDQQSVFLNQLFGGGALQDNIGSDPSLNAFSRTIGQNNYWKMAAAPIGGAKLNTTTWDPGTTAAVTGAQGFLSALLAGYGQRQEAQQLDAVRAVLPQLRAGEDVANPGVDPEAYSGLKLDIANENIDRQAKAALLARETEKERAKLLFQKNLVEDPATGQVVPYKPVIDAEVALDAAKEKLKKDSAGSAFKGTPLEEIAKLPPPLQDDAVKEIALKGRIQKSLNLIDETFAKTSKLNDTAGGAIASLNPLSQTSAEYSAAQANLPFLLDQVLGREINDSARERISKNLPSKWDSDTVSAAKQKNLKDIIVGLAADTPLTGPLQIKGSSSGLSIPEGAVDTGRTSGGKPVYNVGGKLWVPD